MRSLHHVVIVGAGFGGLTAALALVRAGISATVFEQTHPLSELGAQFSIGPNATRLLGALDLLERLREIGMRVAVGNRDTFAMHGEKVRRGDARLAGSDDEVLAHDRLSSRASRGNGVAGRHDKRASDPHRFLATLGMTLIAVSTSQGSAARR